MQDPLKTLQEENAALRRELDALRDSSDRFLALAAHDLQGPLRKIVQSGEILQMDTKDILSEENLYFLDAMNASAHRLRHLIFDLIHFIDLSRQSLERVTLDLNPVVKMSLEACLAEQEDGSSLDASAVEIVELPVVRADPEEMKLLFTALLSNSVKFTKTIKTAEISIKTRLTEGHVHIDIADNGIGIAQVTHVDIFDPFIRLNEKSAYAGSGLGLSVCRLICQRHNWVLSYQKDCILGAVMTVSLPKTDIVLQSD